MTIEQMTGGQFNKRQGAKAVTQEGYMRRWRGWIEFDRGESKAFLGCVLLQLRARGWDEGGSLQVVSEAADEASEWVSAWVLGEGGGGGGVGEGECDARLQKPLVMTTTPLEVCLERKARTTACVPKKACDRTGWLMMPWPSVMKSRPLMQIT